MTIRFRALRFLILFPLLLCSGFSFAGEEMPAWLEEQLQEGGGPLRPGVYVLKDSHLLGVGEGRLHATHRGRRSLRFALLAAERDAKRRIARHLHPEIFDRYRNVSVKMRRATRVHEETGRSEGSAVLVAVLVDPANVAVTPLPSPEVILDARRVEVAPEMLPYLKDPLLQLGGGRIFSSGEGWLVVAVGLAPLFGEDATAERDALKRARVAAGKAIAETVYGSNFDVLEQEVETRCERDGVARFRRWSKTSTREQIEGHLQRAAEFGHWRTNDGHIAVVLAVTDSLAGLDAPETLVIDQEGTAPLYPPDWDMEPQWENVFLEHPRLLEGGAIIYPSSGGLWGICVGAAPLTGDAVNDKTHAPHLAELDAGRSIVKYLLGFSSESVTLFNEEIESIMAERGVNATPLIIESLKSMTQEAATGLVRGLHPVGSWTSEDGQKLYRVFVVDARSVLERK